MWQDSSMKIFKKVLIGVCIFLVLLLAIGFLLPAQVEIKRNLVIHATPAQVHPLIENLKHWEAWTPWGPEVDPTVVYTYSGAEKGVGAEFSWKGEKMGEGSMILTKSDAVSGISYVINFNHGEMTSEGFMAYEPVAEGTQVTWVDKMDLGSNPIKRYFGLLMDSMLGHDFDKGLAKLKQVVEASKLETKP